jgi:hypothetical protein
MIVRADRRRAIAEGDAKRFEFALRIYAGDARDAALCVHHFVTNAEVTESAPAGRRKNRDVHGEAFS